MTSYTADTLDLSRLGAPHFTAIDFEATLRARLLKFKSLWDAARVKNPALPAFDLIAADGSPLIEAEPSIILSQEFAYGEVNVLQALNDHADALRLATAVGADLDHLAQTYKNTPRLVITPATADAPAVLQGDDEYRALAQLSDEAMPLYGITPGGYIWRVKRLFGDRVRDVRALRQPGGRITLIILGRAADGVPAETLLGDIQGAFDGDEGSQSTDIVTVLPARIVPTPINVVIAIPPGPDPAPVIAAATAALAGLADERHKIAETLHEQAVGAVAKVGPVRHVEVIEPAADIVGGDDGAPWVTSITVTPRIER